MQNQKVRVTADELGNVITQSLNPEIGYIRIEQQLHTIGLNNWVKNERRSALIFGNIKDLAVLNFKKDQFWEQHVNDILLKQPFNPETAEREMKLAGSTGVVCRVDDQPIYRRTRYTMNMDEQDTLIQHTNTDEIKEALSSLKAIDNLVLS